MNSPGIYSITQLSTGRHYIGSAVQLERRIARHKSDFVANRHHNSRLQRAWNKHGESDFNFEVIETCGEDALIEREQFWIDSTNPFFNILRHAKSAKGFKHTDTAKAKMSSIQKAVWSTISEEVRRERGSAHAERIRGRKASDETKQKMSASKIGRSSTDEQRASFERNKNSPQAIAKRAAKKARRYIATSPSGEVHNILNLCAFAREHGLQQGHMVAVAKGKRSHHKGWSCIYGTES